MGLCTEDCELTWYIFLWTALWGLVSAVAAGFALAPLSVVQLPDYMKFLVNYGNPVYSGAIILLSMYQCIMFAYRTVVERVTPFLYYCELAFCCLLFIEVIAQILSLPRKWAWSVIGKVMGLVTVDCFIISSQVVMFFEKTWYMEAQNTTAASLGATIAGVAFILGVFMYVCSMLFLIFERLGEPEAFGDAAYDVRADGTEHVTFMSAIYFLFVTVGTVGYGEIVPTNTVSRLFTILVIASGIALFSIHLNAIMDQIRARRRGGGAYQVKKGMRHIVVAGAATARTGSIVDEMDLLRCAARQAIAFVVLPNLSTTSGSDDSDSVVRVMAIKRAAPDARIMCLLTRASNYTLLRTVGVHRTDVVCLDEFKLQLLAKSCVVPGFGAMVCNLVKSIGDEDLETDTPLDSWTEEYFDGCTNELYDEPLSRAYEGWLFRDVVMDILERSENKNVYLIGVRFPYVEDQMANEKRERNVVFYPGNTFKIPHASSKPVRDAATTRRLSQLVNADMSERDEGEQLVVGNGMIRGIFVAQDGSAIVQKPDDEKGAVKSRRFSVTALRQSLPMSNGRKRSSHHSSANAHRVSIGGSEVVHQQESPAEGFQGLQEIPVSDSVLPSPSHHARGGNPADLSSRDLNLPGSVGGERRPSAPLTEDAQWPSITPAEEEEQPVSGEAGENAKEKTSATDEEDGEGPEGGDSSVPPAPVTLPGAAVGNPTPRNADALKSGAAKLRRVTKQIIANNRSNHMNSVRRKHMGEGGIPMSALGMMSVKGEEGYFEFLGKLKQQGAAPRPPPPDVLTKGGHVLFCWIPQKDMKRPTLALEHFVRPLRVAEDLEGTPPTSVVVLSPVVPSDWYMVADDSALYYVEGFSTELFDLERCGFRSARAIVCQLTQSAGDVVDPLVADASCIFTVRLIEGQLATSQSKHVPVIAELIFDSNAAFLGGSSGSSPVDDVARVPASEKHKDSGGECTSPVATPAVRSPTRSTTRMRSMKSMRSVFVKPGGGIGTGGPSGASESSAPATHESNPVQEAIGSLKYFQQPRW
eukprot:Cvel_27360.t1-p1 / transcript=Cvel_27360.t1 / gene=Cvel_27360 / organism=Chromera_velia_CCMP2878 / gene_product=Calcium-activated potassium channel subunit alpha-1, putative / transcript_product=Calcium-activated potassium channel subunit alpha-1, putative / location=Cvel_scaffold3400:286-10478(-) / protein_length=1036 / sequence_SO=supercontig / SO=protein_coding / is_pseudo=false